MLPPLFCFLRRKQKIKAASSSMPMMIPGMKPAANDLPEKSSELSLFSLTVADVDAASAGDVEDASGGLVGSAVLDPDEVAVLAAVELALLAAEDELEATSLSVSAMHNVPEHLKPIGQQASPHVSNLVTGSECNWLPGLLVAF